MKITFNIPDSSTVMYLNLLVRDPDNEEITYVVSRKIRIVDKENEEYEIFPDGVEWKS